MWMYISIESYSNEFGGFALVCWELIKFMRSSFLGNEEHQLVFLTVVEVVSYI